MARAVDWSSLPADIISCVADGFLATNDVDYYISLRAVCVNWRASTDTPRVLDPRFHPRRWVLLELTSDSNFIRCLFLNIDTGRLLWKDLPMLRNYDSVASATDGLLVLEAARDCRVCLLNPFTGHLVRIPATLNFARSFRGMVILAASSCPLLYTLWNNAVQVARIDPTCGESTMFIESGTSFLNITNVATFQGRVYALSREGTVFVEDHSKQDNEPALSTVVAAHGELKYPQGCPHLVDNAGELLIVDLPIDGSSLQVFRVDFENKALETINCIGNRAIFLAYGRCLSVAVDDLPTIESNCIYYIGGRSGPYRIYVHHLEDGREELVGEKVPEYYGCQDEREGPLSLLECIQSMCRHLFIRSTHVRTGDI